MAIPTDLSVTGFDNSTFSGEVGLTTVRQKPYDMAVAAARKALDLIEGRTLDQPHEIFPVQLLVRDSTAARGCAAERGRISRYSGRCCRTGLCRSCELSP